MVWQLDSMQLSQPVPVPPPPETLRRTSSGLPTIPQPVKTDGMSKDELKSELDNFYNTLTSTIAASQDELARLRALLADKDAQCAPPLSCRSLTPALHTACVR